MRIPEVRAELLAIAEDVEAWGMPELAKQLRDLERELYRRSPVRRAPPKEQMSRAERRPLVRAYAAAHPDASEHEIANALGITNSGRVSEDLAGFRS